MESLVTAGGNLMDVGNQQDAKNIEDKAPPTNTTRGKKSKKELIDATKDIKNGDPNVYTSSSITNSTSNSSNAANTFASSISSPNTSTVKAKKQTSTVDKKDVKIVDNDRKTTNGSTTASSISSPTTSTVEDKKQTSAVDKKDAKAVDNDKKDKGNLSTPTSKSFNDTTIITSSSSNTTSSSTATSAAKAKKETSTVDKKDAKEIDNDKKDKGNLSTPTSKSFNDTTIITSSSTTTTSTATSTAKDKKETSTIDKKDAKEIDNDKKQQNSFTSNSNFSNVTNTFTTSTSIAKDKKQTSTVDNSMLASNNKNSFGNNKSQQSTNQESIRQEIVDTNDQSNHQDHEIQQRNNLEAKKSTFSSGGSSKDDAKNIKDKAPPTNIARGGKSKKEIIDATKDIKNGDPSAYTSSTAKDANNGKSNASTFTSTSTPNSNSSNGTNTTTTAPSISSPTTSTVEDKKQTSTVDKKDAKAVDNDKKDKGNLSTPTSKSFNDTTIITSSSSSTTTTTTSTATSAAKDKKETSTVDQKNTKTVDTAKNTKNVEPNISTAPSSLSISKDDKGVADANKVKTKLVKEQEKSTIPQKKKRFSLKAVGNVFSFKAGNKNNNDSNDRSVDKLSKIKEDDENDDDKEVSSAGKLFSTDYRKDGEDKNNSVITSSKDSTMSIPNTFVSKSPNDRPKDISEEKLNTKNLGKKLNPEDKNSPDKKSSQFSMLASNNKNSFGNNKSQQSTNQESIRQEIVDTNDQSNHQDHEIQQRNNLEAKKSTFSSGGSSKDDAKNIKDKAPPTNIARGGKSKKEIIDATKDIKNGDPSAYTSSTAKDANNGKSNASTFTSTSTPNSNSSNGTNTTTTAPSISSPTTSTVEDKKQTSTVDKKDAKAVDNDKKDKGNLSTPTSKSFNDTTIITSSSSSTTTTTTSTATSAAKDKKETSTVDQKNTKTVDTAKNTKNVEPNISTAPSSLSISKDDKGVADANKVKTKLVKEQEKSTIPQKKKRFSLKAVGNVFSFKAGNKNNNDSNDRSVDKLSKIKEDDENDDDKEVSSAGKLFSTDYRKDGEDKNNSVITSSKDSTMSIPNTFVSKSPNDRPKDISEEKLNTKNLGKKLNPEDKNSPDKKSSQFSMLASNNKNSFGNNKSQQSTNQESIRQEIVDTNDQSNHQDHEIQQRNNLEAKKSTFSSGGSSKNILSDPAANNLVIEKLEKRLLTMEKEIEKLQSSKLYERVQILESDLAVYRTKYIEMANKVKELLHREEKGEKSEQLLHEKNFDSIKTSVDLNNPIYGNVAIQEGSYHSSDSKMNINLEEGPPFCGIINTAKEDWQARRKRIKEAGSLVTSSSSKLRENNSLNDKNKVNNILANLTGKNCSNEFEELFQQEKLQPSADIEIRFEDSKLVSLIYPDHNLGFAELPMLTSFLDFEYLKVLNLSNCQMKGNLSDDFTKKVNQLQYLESLNLSKNQLNGNIPREFFSLPKLRILNLSFNQFTGTLEVMSEGENENSTLEVLKLSSNKLTGLLTLEINRLKALKELHIDSNHFYGVFPASIIDLSTSLQKLNISQNQFEGDISSFLPSLQYLHTFRAAKCNFTGELPNDLFSKMENLVLLNLSNNNLVGKLPESISKCIKLQELILANTKLEGNISEMILKSLRELNWFSIQGSNLHFKSSSGLEGKDAFSSILPSKCLIKL